MENLNEFRFPQAKDYNKVVNPDGFWGWSLRNAAEAAQLKPLSDEFKSISDVILWLNHAANFWNSMQHIKKESGENKMQESKTQEQKLRKALREEIANGLKKYKFANVDFKKTGKETPNIKVAREEKKEDNEIELGWMAKNQDEKMKKDGRSGVPTDKEWKRLRTAEEPVSSPSSDEIKEAWNKLIEKVDKDIEELEKLSEKVDDRMINDFIKEVKDVHAQNIQENRERYKYIRLQQGFRPLASRLKAIIDFDKPEKKSDAEKMCKIVEKYINVEVKKKFATETEANEDYEKEALKKLKNNAK